MNGIETPLHSGGGTHEGNEAGSTSPSPWTWTTRPHAIGSAR